MNNRTPLLHPSFELGLLYGVVNGKAMLLQVCEDFDVMQRTLRSRLGSAMPGTGFMENEHMDSNSARAKRWSVRTQKEYDYVFSTFFRHFKAPDQVRNKPEITHLLLMPTHMNAPIVPNDCGDHGDG